MRIFRSSLFSCMGICLLAMGCGQVATDSADVGEYVNDTYTEADGSPKAPLDDIIESLASTHPTAYKAIQEGKRMLGWGYEQPGSDAGKTVDCSNFLRKIFSAALGTELPPASTEMLDAGLPAKWAEHFEKTLVPSSGVTPEPGDILGWYDEGQGHVMMVVDKQNCIFMDSTSYRWDAKLQGKATGTGPGFGRIAVASRCSNGVWKFPNKKRETAGKTFEWRLRLK